MKIVLERDGELAQTILSHRSSPTRQGAYAGVLLRVMSYGRDQQIGVMQTFELNRWTMQLDGTMDTYWDQAWWEAPHADERSGVRGQEVPSAGMRPSLAQPPGGRQWALSGEQGEVGRPGEGDEHAAPGA